MASGIVEVEARLGSVHPGARGLLLLLQQRNAPQRGDFCFQLPVAPEGWCEAIKRDKFFVLSQVQRAAPKCVSIHNSFLVRRPEVRNMDWTQ